MNIKKIAFWSLLFVTLSFSHNALSHSTLSSSSPEDGAVLTKAPDKINLTFNSNVKLVKVTLIQNGENEIPLSWKINKTFVSSFMIKLPALQSGDYQVSWMVMGKDTHKITGDFKFKLKK